MTEKIPEPLTEERLAEIEARANKATEGPIVKWRLLMGRIHLVVAGTVVTTEGDLCRDEGAREQIRAAHPDFPPSHVRAWTGDAIREVVEKARAAAGDARQDIPALLAEVRRRGAALSNARERIHSECCAWRHHPDCAALTDILGEPAPEL